jgi:hypothetical protein
MPAMAGSQHQTRGAAAAQTMQILPADDTGSSAAAGAARSGLDGTGFETGLNAGHSRQLPDTPWQPAQGPDGGLTAAPAACPGRALRTGERPEHHQGPRAGHGPGHRSQRPRTKPAGPAAKSKAAISQ